MTNNRRILAGLILEFYRHEHHTFFAAILGASTEGKEWEKAPNSIASIYIKCEIC